MHICIKRLERTWKGKLYHPKERVGLAQSIWESFYLSKNTVEEKVWSYIKLNLKLGVLSDIRIIKKKTNTQKIHLHIPAPKHGVYEMIKRFSHQWPGHGIVICKDFYDQHIMLCIFDGIIKIDQMISHIPSSSLNLQMPQTGWLFIPEDPKGYLWATSDLIFAAGVHTPTLVFHQKHLDFHPYWKIAVIVSFL